MPKDVWRLPVRVGFILAKSDEIGILGRMTYAKQAFFR